jgi:hypothetical protein
VTGIILPELERHMVVHDSDSVRAVDTQVMSDSMQQHSFFLCGFSVVSL